MCHLPINAAAEFLKASPARLQPTVRHLSRVSLQIAITGFAARMLNVLLAQLVSHSNNAVLKRIFSRNAQVASGNVPTTTLPAMKPARHPRLARPPRPPRLHQYPVAVHTMRTTGSRRASVAGPLIRTTAIPSGKLARGRKTPRLIATASLRISNTTSTATNAWRTTSSTAVGGFGPTASGLQCKSTIRPPIQSTASGGMPRAGALRWS